MHHASIYSGAALLGRIAAFIMLPFYAHLLRGEGYAIIGMIDVGLSLLATLVGYGLSGAIMVHYHAEPDPARKPRVISTGIILGTAAAAALAIVPAILARPVSQLLLNDAGRSHLLIMALASFVADMSGQAARTWLLIRSRSVTFATINLLSLFLALALNILLVVVFRLGLLGYFIANLSTTLVINAIWLSIALRDCGRSFDRQAAEAMKRFMLPLIPGDVVSFASRQVERVLVKFQVDLAAVGILEMGYKFPLLITQLITAPFMQSWSTRRFEMAASPEAPRQIGRMFVWFLFLICYAGLLIAVTIKPLIAVMTPPEFHLSYRIAQIEVLTLIISGAENHLNFGLYYAQHTKVITRLRVGTALVKIALAYFFVSTWGIYGAAFSAAIMATVSLLIGYRLADRRYHLEIEWRKVVVVAGAAAGAFAMLHWWNLASTPGISSVAEKFPPWIAERTRGTFLGEWKDGKVIRILSDDRLEFTEILVKGGLALFYGLLLPWIGDRSLTGPGGLLRLLPFAGPGSRRTNGEGGRA